MQSGCEDFNFFSGFHHVSTSMVRMVPAFYSLQEVKLQAQVLLGIKNILFCCSGTADHQVQCCLLTA